MSEPTERKTQKSRTVIKFADLPAVWSKVAEVEILGAILAGYDEVKVEAVARLDAEDFFFGPHRVLFQAFRDMDAAGEPVDAGNVLVWLQRRSLEDAVGGPEEIGNLMASSGAPILSYRSHITTIAELAALRRLRETCAQIVRDTVDLQHDPSQALSEAESRILRAASIKGSGDFTSISTHVLGAIDQITAAKRRKGVVGIPTGIQGIDNIVHGFKAGEMIVIAARPGVGKTALALSMMRMMGKTRWDDNGKPVTPGYRSAILSLEMMGDVLALRLMSMEAQVGFEKIRDGRTSTYEDDALAVAGQAIAEAPIMVHDDPSTNVNQLRSSVRRVVQRDKVECLFIDYLQLMESGIAKSDSREREVAEISRKLKTLALELKIPIVALSQLNRKPEETGTGEPYKHHLRESGSLEQDADVIIMLWRDPQDGRTLAKVEKQRNGPTGRIPIVFVPEYMAFRDPKPGEMPREERP